MSREPYIDLPASLPGILGLMAFRPETAKPLNELADVLLRGHSPLERGERELIAAFVSRINGCTFCTRAHSAFAARQLDGGLPLVEDTICDPASAPLSAKLRTLLSIAALVATGEGGVTRTEIDRAREAGATDTEIHDTVLIAAALCMYNRYVDGLNTLAPDDPSEYEAMAELIVGWGYSAAAEAIAAGVSQATDVEGQLSAVLD